MGGEVERSDENVLRAVTVNVIDRETGTVEAVMHFSRSEAAMPGYVDHVMRGYEGTPWRAERVSPLRQRSDSTSADLNADQPATGLRRHRDDERLSCGPCAQGRHNACTSGVVTECECRHRDDESPSGARDGVGDE